MPDGSRHVSGEGLRKGVSEINDEEEGGGTYYSLLEWMLWLLYSAIEYEKDTENIQHVLHGMLLSLQDTGRFSLGEREKVCVCVCVCV